MAGSTLIARYLDDIPRDRRLTIGDEQRLSDEIRRGCGNAIAELVEPNLGFVVSIASRYSNFGVPLEDLINEGNLGLIEAARRFDGEREVRFLSYAIWWIRRSILEALQRDGAPLRIPAKQQRRWALMRQGRAQLRQDLGRDPDVGELADHLGVRTELLERSTPTPPRPLGLDEDLPGQGVPVREALADEQRRCAVQELIRQQDLDALGSALAALPSKERGILVRRFGLDGEPGATLQSIADGMGVSREWIRRVEGRALNRLRRHFRQLHRRSLRRGPAVPA